jgi:hypothetical protein
MTQGKIERRHLSLKSRILLENYFLPGDLERTVADFVEHYNHRRYHESLDNLTPADVYFGRGDQILKRREDIKRPSTCAAGSTSTQQQELQPDEPNTLLGQTLNCPEKPDDGHLPTVSPCPIRTSASRRAAMISSVVRPFRAMSTSPFERLEIARFETHPRSHFREAGHGCQHRTLMPHSWLH